MTIIAPILRVSRGLLNNSAPILLLRLILRRVRERPSCSNTWPRSRQSTQPPQAGQRMKCSASSLGGSPSGLPRQCSRFGEKFRHFVTAITGGEWVSVRLRRFYTGWRDNPMRDHRFGYCRRDRIRCLVGLSGCAVKGWEGGCACGVRPDLTACDYVALASRRNTGRILTERYRGFRATCNSLLAPGASQCSRVAAPFVSPVVAQASSCTMIRLRWTSSRSNWTAAAALADANTRAHARARTDIPTPRLTA